MNHIVKFLVVDDHPLFRQGLVSVIGNNQHYQVVGEATNISEALDLVKETAPHVVLIDISLHEENGLELVKTLKSLYPDVTSLVVSMYDEIIYASSALKAGARGYVMKQEAASTLIQAIETVVKGKIYLSADMRERLLDSMVLQDSKSDLDPVEQLSVRELEVLRLLGQGFGVSEIAETLNLSAKTINVYRDNIKHKLAIADARELRKFAIKWAHLNEN
jgi:DNA-binding NarL/FixJ family response regulator